MCGHELSVPGSLPLCIRILLHWNTDKRPDEIVHVYVKGAARLRPDLMKLPPVDWGELDKWIAAHLSEAKPSRQ
jgi:chorismate mutase